MATLAQRVLFAANTTSSGRVQMAVILTALAVTAEPHPTGDTPSDDRARMNVRRSFAREVLKDPVAAAPRMGWVLAGTSLVDITSPVDADFLAAVASVWDALAGA
jgi:hypothetical protein